MANVLALGKENGDIVLFDINASQIVARTNLPKSVPKLTYDGNTLFAASGRDVYSLPATDLKPISTFKNPPNSTHPVTNFHLHGGNLHTSAGRDMRSWDVRRVDKRQTMFRNEHNITCMDYIPRKDMIVMGDTNGRVQGWNVRTQQHDHKDVRTSLPVTCIGVSPHQDWFGVGNSRGEFLPYLCQDEIIQDDTLLLDGVLGDGVQKCVFPQHHADAQQYPVLAFEANIGRYNPLRKDLLWKKHVLGHLPSGLGLPCKLRSCAVSGNGNQIYCGLENGSVVSYHDDVAAAAHLDDAATKANLDLKYALNYVDEILNIEGITGRC